MQICTAIKPIESLRPLHPLLVDAAIDRVYMDLMDFTSQPDGEYHWVLQLKDHFSRMIWLFPLEDKSSQEVANSLRTFIGMVWPT